MEKLYIVNGRKIKELREKAGLSKKEFAKMIDVVESTLYHYEIGNKQPSVRALKLIADCFDLTTEDFIIATNPYDTAHTPPPSQSAVGE